MTSSASRTSRARRLVVTATLAAAMLMPAAAHASSPDAPPAKGSQNAVETQGLSWRGLSWR